MFYHLLHVRKRTAKDVIYQVFGIEEEVGSSKLALAYGGHYKDANLVAADVAVTPIISKLKLANPFKWIEAMFALLYWGADELCQRGAEEGTKLNSSNWLRVSARFLVYCTLSLVAGLVKYISSPYNQIVKPIARMWDQGDRTTAVIIGVVVAAVLVIGVLCVVSLFTGGVPMIPLIVAGLSYAAKALAGWLGGTAAATIAANVLVSIGALTISQAIVQKIFNLGNIAKDFWYGITGRGGYDPKIEYMVTEINKLSPGAVDSDNILAKAADPADPNNIVAKSLAYQHFLFNTDLGINKDIPSFTSAITARKSRASVVPKEESAPDQKDSTTSPPADLSSGGSQPQPESQSQPESQPQTPPPPPLASGQPLPETNLNAGSSPTSGQPNTHAGPPVPPRPGSPNKTPQSATPASPGPVSPGQTAPETDLKASSAPTSTAQATSSTSTPPTSTAPAADLKANSSPIPTQATSSTPATAAAPADQANTATTSKEHKTELKSAATSATNSAAQPTATDKSQSQPTTKFPTAEELAPAPAAQEAPPAATPAGRTETKEEKSDEALIALLYKQIIPEVIAAANAEGITAQDAEFSYEVRKKGGIASDFIIAHPTTEVRTKIEEVLKSSFTAVKSTITIDGVIARSVFYSDFLTKARELDAPKKELSATATSDEVAAAPTTAAQTAPASAPETQQAPVEQGKSTEMKEAKSDETVIALFYKKIITEVIETCRKAESPVTAKDTEFELGHDTINKGPNDGLHAVIIAHEEKPVRAKIEEILKKYKFGHIEKSSIQKRIDGRLVLRDEFVTKARELDAKGELLATATFDEPTTLALGLTPAATPVLQQASGEQKQSTETKEAKSDAVLIASFYKKIKAQVIEKAKSESIAVQDKEFEMYVPENKEGFLIGHSESKVRKKLEEVLKTYSFSSIKPVGIDRPDADIKVDARWVPYSEFLAKARALDAQGMLPAVTTLATADEEALSAEETALLDKEVKELDAAIETVRSKLDGAVGQLDLIPVSKDLLDQITPARDIIRTFSAAAAEKKAESDKQYSNFKATSSQNIQTRVGAYTKALQKEYVSEYFTATTDAIVVATKGILTSAGALPDYDSLRKAIQKLNALDVAAIKTFAQEFDIPAENLIDEFTDQKNALAGAVFGATKSKLEVALDELCSQCAKGLQEATPENFATAAKAFIASIDGLKAKINSDFDAINSDLSTTLKDYLEKQKLELVWDCLIFRTPSSSAAKGEEKEEKVDAVDPDKLMSELLDCGFSLSAAQQTALKTGIPERIEKEATRKKLAATAKEKEILETLVKSFKHAVAEMQTDPPAPGLLGLVAEVERVVKGNFIPAEALHELLPLIDPNETGNDLSDLKSKVEGLKRDSGITFDTYKTAIEPLCNSAKQGFGLPLASADETKEEATTSETHVTPAASTTESPAKPMSRVETIASHIKPMAENLRYAVSQFDHNVLSEETISTLWPKFKERIVPAVYASEKDSSNKTNLIKCVLSQSFWELIQDKEIQECFLAQIKFIAEDVRDIHKELSVPDAAAAIALELIVKDGQEMVEKVYADITDGVSKPSLLITLAKPLYDNLLKDEKFVGICMEAVGEDVVCPELSVAEVIAALNPPAEVVPPATPTESPQQAPASIAPHNALFGAGSAAPSISAPDVEPGVASKPTASPKNGSVH